MNAHDIAAPSHTRSRLRRRFGRSQSHRSWVDAPLAEARCLDLESRFHQCLDPLHDVRFKSPPGLRRTRKRSSTYELQFLESDCHCGDRYPELLMQWQVLSPHGRPAGESSHRNQRTLIGVENFTWIAWTQQVSQPVVKSYWRCNPYGLRKRRNHWFLRHQEHGSEDVCFAFFELLLAESRSFDWPLSQQGFWLMQDDMPDLMCACKSHSWQVEFVGDDDFLRLGVDDSRYLHPATRRPVGNRAFNVVVVEQPRGDAGVEEIQRMTAQGVEFVASSPQCTVHAVNLFADTLHNATHYIVSESIVKHNIWTS